MQIDNLAMGVYNHARRDREMKATIITGILLSGLLSACSVKNNPSADISSFINTLNTHDAASTCRFVYQDKTGTHELNLSGGIYENIKKALLHPENYTIKDSLPLVSPPLGTFYIGGKGYVWSGHANLMPLDRKDILVKLPACFTLPEEDFLEIIDNINDAVKVRNTYDRFFRKM